MCIRDRSAVLSLTLGLIILIPSTNLYFTLVLFILIGASGSVMVSAFALVKEAISKEAQGSAVGIVNAMTVAAGAILQPFVGLILDLRWDGLMLNGARIFNETDYRFAFTIVFVSSLIGFFVSVTLKEQPKL